MVLLVAILLFAGSFAHITLLSRNAHIGKQISAAEREIDLSVRRKTDLQLQINEAHNMERIAQRAEQLGMTLPAENQVCVLQVFDNGFVQSAGMNGGEE